MYQFGISNIWVNPVSGNLATNPTPHHVGTVDSASIDISQSIVKLVGQNQWPDDIAPGDKAGTGKIILGQIEIDLFNQILFADTSAAGIENMNIQTANIPASTPFTINVANAAQFNTDFGVEFATTSGTGIAKQHFKRVASGPTGGQYTVSTGLYTFSSTDNNASVTISYTSNVAATGNTLTANQQVMGYGPTFELFIAEQYTQASSGSNFSSIHLFACKVSKLSKALKNKDYLKPEIDFEFFANASGQVLKFAQANPA